MMTFGQICLFAAFVGSGYAAFACLVGWRSAHRGVLTSGLWAGLATVLALTGTIVALAWALVTKDFRFEYVVQYSDSLLPWHYSLSALWVGQAGSLLVWAWFLAVLAVAHRFWRRREASELREPAFGVLMAYLAFLVAVLVFAADPMQPSLASSEHGNGLSPSLQHPAMLIHPPVVFLGYAAWGVPFALAVAALLTGRFDATWVREARSWALFAWAVLGTGILIGALWAYEELGWGGYWSWDPVENGSLIPWLTGTALIHCLMTWRHVGLLKKAALGLAIGTFGLCNFATFLTRSGIFGSLHEFSRSPIGWMFLAWMLTLAVGGSILVTLRRSSLAPDRPISSLVSREAVIMLATVALVLLAAVALVGTLAVPLSGIFAGPKITVGPAFYNNVLIPIGLGLLAATAAAPLLRWGAAPTSAQRRMFIAAAFAGGVSTIAAFALGVRHPIGLAVAGLAAMAVAVLIAALVIDVRRQQAGTLLLRPVYALTGARGKYAGYLVHVGFVCLAVGIAGSSLGTLRQDFVMAPGETVEWAGRTVRYTGIAQRELPDKFIAEAQLEVSSAGERPYSLLPARHLHRPQNEWTAEVAIHSTWRGDFYAILLGGREGGGASLTLVENPLMRWLWLSGWVSGIGALVGLWPSRRHAVHPANEVSAKAALRGPHRPNARRREVIAHG